MITFEDCKTEEEMLEKLSKYSPEEIQKSTEERKAMVMADGGFTQEYRAECYAEVIFAAFEHVARDDVGDLNEYADKIAAIIAEMSATLN